MERKIRELAWLQILQSIVIQGEHYFTLRVKRIFRLGDVGGKEQSKMTSNVFGLNNFEWYIIYWNEKAWRTQFRLKDIKMFGVCYILNNCGSPRFICWGFNSQCDGIWTWGLWARIPVRGGMRGGWGPHNGICAPIERDTRTYSLTHMWALFFCQYQSFSFFLSGHLQENTARRWQAKKRALARKKTGQHFDFRFSTFQNYEKKKFCCLTHAVYGILLWQTKQSKTVYANFDMSSIHQVGSWIYNSGVQGKDGSRDMNLEVIFCRWHLKPNWRCIVYVHYMFLGNCLFVGKWMGLANWSLIYFKKSHQVLPALLSAYLVLYIMTHFMLSTHF